MTTASPRRTTPFLYREKIWEDDKASITGGHIHVGSLLEICASTVFLLRRLAMRTPLAPRYRLVLDLSGMKGRGVVAQVESAPSDMLLVDAAKEVSTKERCSASIEATLEAIASFPLGVVYDLVAEALLELRPDLAHRGKLERQLRLRHAFDDRRGRTRF